VNELNALARSVVLAGFEGETFDTALPQFGGYLLFARNTSSLQQIRALTDALRARRFDDGTAPAIAIDQEGGRVVRLRNGIEPMPSMMALGAAADLELAGRAGEQVAFDLRRAGCTMNLAPVLDLASLAEQTAIGTRSLGSRPQDVAALGAAFGAGLERGGVVPCYKHFPGHGATATDSHETLPRIADDAKTLRSRDLVPFADVARTAPAMLAAHVVATAFDERNPATASARILSGLLRDELQFGGALLTDCLQMGAVDERSGTVASALAALVAGADVLVVSRSPELALQVVAAIECAVSDGTLPRARLEEAFARAATLRRAAQAPLPLDTFPPHPGVGREIARRGVTLVRGFAHADPLTTIVVSFDGDSTEGINATAAPARESLRHESPALAELHLPLDPSEEEVDAALAAIRTSGRRALMLARRAHLHGAQAVAIDRILDDAHDALVVSMLEPFDVPLFGRARHVLAAYGDDAAAIGGLADVLFGGTLPGGQMPVDLGDFARGA
jgi:beta-N-acetylhexosaminidase